MGTLVDIGGQRFGAIVAVAHQGAGKWLTVCDCGTNAVRRSIDLRNGLIKSCGCQRGSFVTASKLKHGMCETPEYLVWNGMRDRCSDPRNKRWARYGGRGISVCERWQTFENFYADMGPRPSAKHQLDRVWNDGNYEPDNCRWATIAVQASNRCDNRVVTALGQTRTLSEWARISGMTTKTISRRLNIGWQPDRAVTEKPDARFDWRAKAKAREASA